MPQRSRRSARPAGGSSGRCRTPRRSRRAPLPDRGTSVSFAPARSARARSRVRAGLRREDLSVCGDGIPCQKGMLVWVLYQFSHQTPRRKIARQELDQISPRQKDTAAEDDSSRDGPNGIVERVETGRREHEPTDHR